MNHYQGVFFDLDGTLVDTAADMGLALNTVLAAHDQQPLPLATIRPHVSHGSAALIELGFGIDSSSAPGFEGLKQAFLKAYQTNIAIHSRLFDGMAVILNKLEQAGIHWGIVTNKPGYLTQQLLEKLQLFDRAKCVISGDSLSVRKPHPKPLLTACELASCCPDQCLYVGDAERDIIAAKAANMKACAALYGYVDTDDNPGGWQADIYIRTASELADHIRFTRA